MIATIRRLRRAGARLFQTSALVAIAHTGSAVAADESPYLLGDWNGQRSALEQRGFGFEAILTADVLANVSGGIAQEVEVPTNLDLIGHLDTGAAGWWNNGTFTLYLLGNVGGNPSAHAGDLQGLSNISAPATLKVFEAWYEHRFFDDKMAVLVGLHDMASDFYVNEFSGVFVNSTFGIGPEIAQVGPSIFPVSSVGTRVRVNPTPNTYVLAALYDGVPGDPDNPHGTHIEFNHGDGVFTIGEAGFTGGKENYYKIGIGGWYHTKQFDDFAGVPHSDNSGIYVIGEKSLIKDESSGRELGAFVRVGFTDEDSNPLSSHVDFGFSLKAPFSGRENDVAGIAVARARNGRDFRNFTGANHAETAIEATYLVAAQPWLNVQPDIQYIIDPGTDPALEDAVVLGVRLQITF